MNGGTEGTMPEDIWSVDPVKTPKIPSGARCRWGLWQGIFQNDVDLLDTDEYKTEVARAKEEAGDDVNAKIKKPPTRRARKAQEPASSQATTKEPPKPRPLPKSRVTEEDVNGGEIPAAVEEDVQQSSADAFRPRRRGGGHPTWPR